MDFLFHVFVLFLVAEQGYSGVSSKTDFGTDEESGLADAEDVEVKHTIVVSTKLTNNNPQRRGIHSGRDNNGEVIHNFGKSKDNDEDVPVVKGFKAVDTTRIRTPDTRNKPKNTEAIYISRNLQDDYNVYPGFSPSQWKPSNLFNNINWWEPESNNVYSLPKLDNTVKFQRKITDESMKEFYCKRCRELSQGQYKDCFGAHQSRSAWNYQSVQSTTPKIKIDGKIAKLN